LHHHHHQAADQEWEAPDCWLHTTTSELYASASASQQARATRFVVVRDPYQHVASIYNHCKEKNEVDGTDLEGWLDTWDANDANTNGANCDDSPINPQSWSVMPADVQLEEQFVLSHLYDTVGLTEEPDKTACLISIAVHRRVPPQCDCSTSDGSKRAKTDDDDSTMMILTEEQRQAIAKLNDRDLHLYAVAQSLFRKEVERVQEQYNFEMC